MPKGVGCQHKCGSDLYKARRESHKRPLMELEYYYLWRNFKCISSHPWHNKDVVIAKWKCLDPQCGVPSSPSYLCLFPVVNLCDLKTVATTLLIRMVLTVWLKSEFCATLRIFAGSKAVIETASKAFESTLSWGCTWECCWFWLQFS